jgi:hypothetical protein
MGTRTGALLYLLEVEQLTVAQLGHSLAQA